MNIPSYPEESERTKFSASLGQCISIWSYIEEQMSWVLTALFLSETEKNLISAIFYSASMFEQKLRMVDVAMKFALPKKLEDQWLILHKRLSKKHGKRNHIAHFQIILEPKGNPPKFKPVLRPHVSNAKAMLEDTKHMYAQHDLDALFLAFNHLLADLTQFRIQVAQELSSRSRAK